MFSSAFACVTREERGKGSLKKRETSYEVLHKPSFRFQSSRSPFSFLRNMALTLARAPAVAPSLSARASSRRSTSTVIVRAAAASPRELANKVRLNWRDSERRCITKTSCQTDHVKFVSLSLSLPPSLTRSFASIDRKDRRHDVSGRAPRRWKRHG